MEGLERCPGCDKLPVITKDRVSDKLFWFTCSQANHVHQACGDTVEGAKANWNLYAILMRQAA